MKLDDNIIIKGYRVWEQICYAQYNIFRQTRFVKVLYTVTQVALRFNMFTIINDSKM